MSPIPDNVRQVLVQLLPANIINDIKCYVFYDNHPQDERHIDIIIYTITGEVREYFQRDLVSSVDLENMGISTEIRIMRNRHSELFYLVTGGEELIILSRKDKLEIHQRLTDVASFKICDSACSGEAVLNVVLHNSEIPIVPDDNFENFKPVDFIQSLSPLLQGAIITHLKRKLVEAKHSVKCSEKSLDELLNIRQQVAFTKYKNMHPNLDDSVFKDGMIEMSSAVKLFTEKPWIKTLNKKIVVVHNIVNENEEPLEEIQILLHGTTRQCLEYTTKIFEKTSTPPFCKETISQKLLPNVESALVVVIDLEELKDNIVSKIEFDGVIIYMKNENQCFLQTDTVTLRSLDTMGEQFDVMCNDLADKNIMLAILATSEKTELKFRHIKRPNEQYITFNIFNEYLNMERVPYCDNVVIYRKSPYHVLNGVMIILDNETMEGTGSFSVAVYSRSSSQILALIHHIQDAVPYRIIITTANYIITSKSDAFSIYNESSRNSLEQVPNYMNYTTSMLNRTRLVLEYLDNSMIKMSESKNAVIRNKIGTEIDLFAQGEVGLEEFKKKMLDEAANGVEKIQNECRGMSLE